MSMIVWAGIGLVRSTTSARDILVLNTQIDRMLATCREPFASIIEPNMGRRYRYRFGDTLVTDIRDRNGERVGFGIEACDEKDAERHIVTVQTLCNQYDVDAWISVWAWERMTAAPQSAPVETFA